MWNKVRRIKAASSSFNIPGIIHNNIVETDHQKIVNIFAEYFSNICSTNSYDQTFQTIKTQQETTEFAVSESLNMPYNSPILINELESALQSCRNSSPGPDDLHYEMIKNLPYNAKIILLEIYNIIWQNGVYPTNWRKAILIPILKPGKDRSEKSSYRPIALTSCLSKLLEKIVSKRLTWYLETENLFNKNQLGFRENKSTIDAIIILENEIRNAYLHKEHMILVSFDIEKAYDLTWKFRILQKLNMWKISGNIFNYIENFLKNRQFEVKINNLRSKLYPQENGVPQGSVMSVLLFLIAINDITENINYPVKTVLYADDLIIYCSGRNLSNVQRFIQSAICYLEAWCRSSGFKFSNTKTKCINFCQCRLRCPRPIIKLFEKPISYVEQFQYLGVIFDRKLTWIPYLRQLKTSCHRHLSLIKSLAYNKWSSDKTTLSTIFKALILSRLEYGCIVYQTAQKNALKMLDTIYNTGLRIIIGAFRSSPILSIYNEAGELPPNYRRDMVTLKYACRVMENPEHVNYKILSNPAYVNLYEKNPKLVKPTSIHIQNLSKKYQIEPNKLACSTYNEMPPWMIPKFNIDISLTQYKKQNSNPEMYKKILTELLDLKYKHHIHIYTDGSKLEDDRVGCAYYSIVESRKYKLNPLTSIHTAELFAIQEAIKFIKTRKPPMVLILIDSLSAIQSIQKMYSRNVYVKKIQDIFMGISKTSEINFMWIPSHIGIRGNERADQLAREAAELTTMTLNQYVKEELFTQIKKKILTSWNHQWQNITNNKLRRIKNTTEESVNVTDRRTQIAITRMRLGHTNITHRHLMTGTSPPLCECNQAIITVEHLLCECSKYNTARHKHKIPGTIQECFKNSHDSLKKIIEYIEETGLIGKI